MNCLKKPFVKLLLLLFVLFILQPTISYALSIETEVLTLNEASVFLRINQKDLENLAIRNALPGRLIGNEWRFSKAALINWLSGQETKRETVLSSAELSNTLGRDSGAERNLGSQAVDEKPDAVGSKPESINAEDVFLRNETVMLKARELSVEWNLLYSYSDHQDILSSSERESFILDLGFSYGLANNLQLFASIPFTYQKETATALEERQREISRHFGHVTLGLRRSVLQEGLWKPEVILSIEGQFSTGDNSYGLGISAAFVKSLDPAVLFANIAYQYNLKQRNQDLLLSESKSRISASLGYAYALNDTLTLGTSVSGIFPQGTASGNNSLSQTKKQFSLQLGITSLLSKDIYIEPSVSFGLNRAASDVTLGASIVYTIGH